MTMGLNWDLSTKSLFQQENILSTYLQGLEPKVVSEGMIHQTSAEENYKAFTWTRQD